MSMSNTCLCVLWVACAAAYLLLYSLWGQDNIYFVQYAQLLLLFGFCKMTLNLWILLGESTQEQQQQDQQLRRQQEQYSRTNKLDPSWCQHQQQQQQHDLKSIQEVSLCIPALQTAETQPAGQPVDQLQLDDMQQQLEQTPCNTTAVSTATSADRVAAAAAAADSGVMDVWVLAGQSNCVGTNQADGQTMPSAAAPWPGKIFRYDSNGGQWKEAVPNVHLGVYGYADADSCGPDMAFARTLIKMKAAHKVGLVPTACGGTNLYEQWVPGGLLWSNMVTHTTAALEALGSKGKLAGIIWIQGESDAVNLVTASAYGSHFTAWLAATRAALQPYHPCVPLVMAVMATRQRQGAFPFIDVVAQQQWALKLPRLLKVDMSGYEFYDGGDGNLVHLTKAGCCALGAAMAFEIAACCTK